MRDYLNAQEKNQFMVIASVLQVIEGVRRNEGLDGPKIATMLEEWSARGNMTKDEHRSLKTAETYLRKFITSVFNRMNPKERVALEKRLMKFDFKLIDDFTLKKINRDISNRLVNAVVPRQQFYDWCSEIMHVKCNGCTKAWDTCDLYEVFEENFVPESGFDCKNCKFAYENNTKG